MKVKIVIKVYMCCSKQTKKAMEIASGMCGVTSIAITGKEKDELEVVGDGVDSVKLTSAIRKKICRNATLVRVEEVKPKEEPEKVEQPSVIPSSNYDYHHQYAPPVYACELVYNPNPCSIW